MKISYAITVCNELEEIKKLIPYLLQHKREEDEIVVLHDDKGNTETDEIFEFINNIQIIHYFSDDFSQILNFGEWKNILNSVCKGNYIFNIDADEIPSQTLIKNLPLLLESNPEIDLYWVPRENYVKNITPLHLQKWGWVQDDKGRINYPDVQSRIYRNSPNIKWEGKVHERIVGYKTYSSLPINQDWDLLHIKSLERQEKQNNYYETL
jgi:hypothetical protein